jgi:hypothetical protein
LDTGDAAGQLPKCSTSHPDGIWRMPNLKLLSPFFSSTYCKAQSSRSAWIQSRKSKVGYLVLLSHCRYEGNGNRGFGACDEFLKMLYMDRKHKTHE